ncbi:hypothetical protein P167DRAFT_585993, partial [Morchella conica CCBAS932]
GHLANDCTNNRYIEYSRALEKSAEEAWDGMALASEEDDFDAFKICMLEYIRACPGAKFNELESSFRSSGWNYYLYALTREPEYHECIVGPNGELDAKYVWTLNKSPKPRRSKAIKDRMDPTAEGNLARLAFAGEIMPETKPFCHTCRVKGHSKRGCEVEVPERDRERVVLKCGNCDALDHRLRDCTLPRKPDYNPMECKNCHEEGHKASDCPMPRVADENTECRKCNESESSFFVRGLRAMLTVGLPGQEGHRSSDCTNEKVIKCRNCDVYGHSARECPMPKDISRIKCNNCGESKSITDSISAILTLTSVLFSFQWAITTVTAKIQLSNRKAEAMNHILMVAVKKPPLMRQRGVVKKPPLMRQGGMTPLPRMYPLAGKRCMNPFITTV